MARKSSKSAPSWKPCLADGRARQKSLRYGGGGDEQKKLTLREETRTSESSPLIVNWLSRELTGTPGLIGMTMAPGKKHTGYTGSWDRSLSMDLARLKDHYKVGCIVSLMEHFEYRNVKIPTFFEAAYASGIEVVWYPIEDMEPPLSLIQTRKLVQAILLRATAGNNVVIHCRGGIGRTGTIASCVLVALGYSAATAIKEVQKTRRHTITRKSQQDFVREFGNGA